MGKKSNEKLERRVEAALKQKESALLARTVSVSQSMSYSGPVPPAEIVRGWNELVPNAAERILTMSETEGAHRRELEVSEQSRIVDATRREQWSRILGQVFGFATVVGFGCAGFWLTISGFNAQGLASIATALGLIVGYFVVGRRAKNSD